MFTVIILCGDLDFCFLIYLHAKKKSHVSSLSLLYNFSIEYHWGILSSSHKFHCFQSLFTLLFSTFRETERVSMVTNSGVLCCRKQIINWKDQVWNTLIWYRIDISQDKLGENKYSALGFKEEITTQQEKK